MALQNINLAKPPVVWSSVDDAFQQVNANFTEIFDDLRALEVGAVSWESIPDKPFIPSDVSEITDNQGLLNLEGYATETYVDSAVSSIIIPSLEGYATETYVDSAITAIPPSTGDTGNVTFNESTINTSNLSDITFIPNVLFQSNITLEGDIITTGSGTPELFSDNDIVLTASERVIINTSPIKMASFTTVERDELIAQSGDVIYNTTANKFQGYANNVWVDLH
jgi:hypothetical protein